MAQVKMRRSRTQKRGTSSKYNTIPSRSHVTTWIKQRKKQWTLWNGTNGSVTERTSVSFDKKSAAVFYEFVTNTAKLKSKNWIDAETKSVVFILMLISPQPADIQDILTLLTAWNTLTRAHTQMNACVRAHAYTRV